MEAIFSTYNWTIGISVIGVLYAIYISTKSTDELIAGEKTSIFAIIFIGLVAIYIGTRPIWCYADTKLYTTMFQLVQNGYWESFKNAKQEPIWTYVANLHVKYADASSWLFTISVIYVGGMAYAAYKWLPRHFFIAVIFLLTAFSFWGYATNGIRHGMATSIALIGLTFFNQNKPKLIIAYSVLVIASLIHSSTLLVIASVTMAIFLKNTKHNISIWLICIALSFILQEPLKTFMSTLINDNRMTNYLMNMEDQKDLFSVTGFRWDFIIYSSFPIILGYYTIIKKGFTDKTYSLLLNTYIFSNAFWVLINSAAYSNRFAYLSWFLFPILIAYPICKFRIFPRQGIVACLILFISIAFTFVMQI